MVESVKVIFLNYCYRVHEIVIFGMSGLWA